MDTTEKIEPALTPEEWETRIIRRPGVGAEYVKLGVHRLFAVEGDSHEGEDFDCGEVELSQTSTRHAIAAIALHGQPFGFTREHLEAFNALLTGRMDEEAEQPGGSLIIYERRRQLLIQLAARIEALLPPPRVETVLD